MSPLKLYIFTEDKLGLVVARKIAAFLKFEIAHADELKGNSRLKANIKKYNEIAKRFPVLVLTDLDEKECAPTLFREWTQGFEVNRNLMLRINVREVEAWLFGDATGFAEFLGMEADNIPRNPESLLDPKQKLFSLIKSKSRKRRIREGLLPLHNSRLGPEYNTLLGEFVNEKFNLTEAQQNCQSLARAMKAMESVKKNITG